MQRCCHCHGRFGLVSHRLLFRRFCSRQCLGIYRRNLAAAIEARVNRWFAILLAPMVFGKSRTNEPAHGRRARVLEPFSTMRRHP
jgi:hypothetical protein